MNQVHFLFSTYAFQILNITIYSRQNKIFDTRVKYILYDYSIFMILLRKKNYFLYYFEHRISESAYFNSNFCHICDTTLNNNIAQRIFLQIYFLLTCISDRTGIRRSAVSWQRIFRFFILDAFQIRLNSVSVVTLVIIIIVIVVKTMAP